jgi:CDP-diglyceride synthetase
MPEALPMILSLLIGAAGWYYLFYSRAAQRLVVIEAQRANDRRVRLRRANGAAMIVLAVLLYLGSRAIDPQQRPRAFVVTWLAAFVSLLVIVALGLADVRLTLGLRKSARRDRDA